jgi:hypothetical protein
MSKSKKKRREAAAQAAVQAAAGAATRRDQKSAPAEAETAQSVAAPDDQSSPLNLKKWAFWTLDQALEWVPLLLAMGFYVMMKFFALRPSSSDENIYFYMAWAIIDHGAVPYRDFFLAHPPLQLYLMWLWIALFKFTLAGCKAVPWISFTISGLFFHRLLRTGNGRISSFVGLILYVYAYDCLRASSHFTGINETVLFLVPSMWALWKYRNALAGVLMSLGALCGTYIMPAGGFMLLWVLLGRGRKATLRFFLGLSVPYTIVMSIFFAITGVAFLKMQFLYHVIKPEEGGEAWIRFKEVSYDNHLLALSWLMGGILLIASLIAATLSHASKGPRGWLEGWREWAARPYRVRALYAAGMVLIYFLFLFNLKRVFPFYYLLVFSSMAWLGAYMVEELIQVVLGFVRGTIAASQRFKVGTVTVLMVAATLILYSQRYEFGLKYVRDHLYFQAQRYQWIDAPYIGNWANAWMKYLTWIDVAEPGREYNAVTRVMWHETFMLERVDEVANYIRAHTTRQDLIFGDSTSLPLIALMADRLIIDDFADTNIMRFRSGMTPPLEAIKQIDRPELKYIVARNDTGFFRVWEFQQWIADNFVLDNKVPEQYKGLFLIYRRKTSS